MPRRAAERATACIFEAVRVLRKSRPVAGLQEPPADACIFMHTPERAFLSAALMAYNTQIIAGVERPYKMNSRARNAISGVEKFIFLAPGTESRSLRIGSTRPCDYLVALLSALYHRQRALRHLERLASRMSSSSWSLSRFFLPPGHRSLIAFVLISSLPPSPLQPRNFTLPNRSLPT